MAHNIEVHVRLRPVQHGSIWVPTVGTLTCHVKADVTHQFDTVHPMSTSNETLFTSIKPILFAALEGTNTSVMAYGQTGSGKTHSMVGTNADFGIIRRSAQILLDRVAASNGMHLRASCIEIYNEKVRDLMTTDSAELEVNQAPDGSVKVDKKEVSISTMDDFLMLWNQADKSRKYGVTDLNEHSSRSHFLLTFHISKGPYLNQLIFVDLAGSESAARAGTHGTTMREGGFINKSLLALGNVVDALADGRTPVYRDSKLTRILSPCLGGKGLTHILCCINPTRDNYDQTSAALRFAQRAKKITSDITTTIGTIPFEFYQTGQDLRKAAEELQLSATLVRESAAAKTFLAVRKCVRTLFDNTGEEAELALKRVRELRLLKLGRERLVGGKRLRAEQESCRVDGRVAVEGELTEMQEKANQYATDIEQGREKVRRLEKALDEDKQSLNAKSRRIQEDLESMGDEFEKMVELFCKREIVARLGIIASYSKGNRDFCVAHHDRMCELREPVLNGPAQVKQWKQQLSAAKQELKSLEEALVDAEGAIPPETDSIPGCDVADEALKKLEPSIQRILELEQENRALDDVLKRKPSMAPPSDSEDFGTTTIPASRVGVAPGRCSPGGPRTARGVAARRSPSTRPATTRSTFDAIRDVQTRFLTAEERAQLARTTPPRPKTTAVARQPTVVTPSPKPKSKRVVPAAAAARGGKIVVTKTNSVTPVRSSLASSTPSPVPRAAQATKSSRAKQKTTQAAARGGPKDLLQSEFSQSPAPDDDSIAARIYRDRLERENKDLVERSLFESPVKGAPKKKRGVAVAATNKSRY